MGSNNLVGTLPDLSDLTVLSTFYAWDNHLSGPIPSLSGLTALYDFQVDNNQLSGPIPSLSGLTALGSFVVSYNHLSGPIPSLGGLTALYGFAASSNQLSGPIPSLSGLTALVGFEVSQNQLTGPIPNLSGFTKLRFFYVDQNQLTGPIPNLSGLTALQYFVVGRNQLTGPIPSLNGLTALRSFDVSENQLTGPMALPPNPSSLLSGASDLCGNRLTTTGNASADEAWDVAQGSDWLACQNTPPTIVKSFGAASIPLNGSTSLSFTINNPNGSANLTGVGFGDALPAGLVVSTPNGLTGSCGGGTITATAGSGSISLANATLDFSASCTFSVDVTGTTVGTKNNTTGAVTSVEGGPGGTASASVTVGTVAAAPPAIVKSFDASSIPLNGTTSLSFTINNPNGSATLTGIGVTDALPAGLVVSTPNGLTGSCGGGTITASAGSGSISLTGATLDGSASCTFSVDVTGTTAGTKNNTTGAVTSIEGGPGGTASASVTVGTVTGAVPPTIAKSFGAGSIPLNGTTSLSFAINNPNGSATLTGVGFADALPAGLVVSTPNGVTGSCGGGTITATAGSGSISLGNATLAGSASCTFSVNVTGATAGTKNNTTGAVTSIEGGPGGTASASVTVGTVTGAAPPAIVKSFGAGSIPLNGSTSLSFTINNPNGSATLTGIGVSDSLPAGLVVSTPNALTGSCGGGTITAAAGSGSISLANATLAGSASCTFSVNVTGATAGTKNNTTGAVTSVEGGPGGTASASVTVAGVCTYSLSPLDLSNTTAAGGPASITVTTPSGCPVRATSYQPWVTVNNITPNGPTTTVALQISPNAGVARATAIVVADRLFLITQLGP